MLAIKAAIAAILITATAKLILNPVAVKGISDALAMALDRASTLSPLKNRRLQTITWHALTSSPSACEESALNGL